MPENEQSAAGQGALTGRRIAVLATDGVEQVELVQPLEALRNAGATVDLVSLKPGEIQGFNHLDKGDRFPVDRVVEEVRVSEYSALVIPGGVANPDAMRMDERAVSLVRQFMEHDKP